MSIGMEMITELLETVSYSAYLKDEKPVSLILAAPPEHFKTSSMIAIESPQNILVTAFTPYGFIRDYYSAVKRGKIRYIMVPDLSALFSSVKTRNDVVGFLLDLLEHGIVNISKYWNEGKRDVVDEHVKLGVIMAAVPSFLTDRRHRWLYDNGFLSRFLVISYEYDSALLSQIHEAVISGENKLVKEDLEYPEVDVIISCKPRFIKKLDPLIVVTQKKQRSYGIRLREQVRTLLMANALKHERIKVSDEDVIEIGAFLKHVNLDINPLRPFDELKEEVMKEFRLNSS